MENKKEEYTPENLLKLHSELLSYHNEKRSESTSDKIQTTIENIMDLLIYDDKNDCGIFDSFCELNVISELIYYAISYGDREITLQIIKSLSVFILSIQNKKSLYFIFSNNFLNKIISLNKISEIDYDFLSYYVNFLKSLSLKLTQDTIQFFFHSNINSFPLFENAFHLYNYNDPMISNVVRNIFLTFCKINDTNFNNEYLSTLPSIEYFAFIACRLRERMQKLYINSGDVLNFDIEEINDILDDIINDILYIQDIFSLNIDKINFILSNCLMYYLILPCIFGVLVDTSNQKFCDHKIALYMLCAFLYYINNETFLNCLFTLLTFESLSQGIIHFIEELPSNSKNYCFDFEKRDIKNTFFDFIVNHFDNKFISGMTKEVNEYSEKYINEIKEIKDKLKLNEGEDIERINEDKIINTLYNSLSSNEKTEMKKFHYEISIATGVNCGCVKLDEEDDMAMYKKSVLGKIDRMYEKVSTNQKEKFTRNTIKDKLYEMLKSEDDNIKILISILFYLLLTKKNINHKIRKYANMITYSDYTSTEKKINDNAQNGASKYKFDDVYFFNKKFPITFTSKIQNGNNIAFSYDSTLVLNLITSIFSEKKHFRTSTSITISCLKSLFSQSSTESQCPILTVHKDLISKAYYVYIASLIHQITNDQDVFSVSFEVFENQYKKFTENINDNLLKYIKNPYIFISPETSEEEEPDKDTNIEIEIFKWDLLNFIYIDDLLNHIEGRKHEEKFPLKNAYLKYQIGDNVCLLDKGIESYKVTSDKESEMIIILIQNVILFAKDMSTINSMNNYAQISQKFALRNISVELKDNIGKNKNKLHMLFKGKDSLNIEKEYTISFINEEENNDLVFRIYEKVSDMKRIALIQEKEHVKKYFDDIMIEYSKSK